MWLDWLRQRKPGEREQDREREDKPKLRNNGGLQPHSWVGLLVLFGSSLLWVCLYFERDIDPASKVLLTAVSFGQNVGLAFISLGVIGILLEFRDWREYFQKRVAEVIINREYLKTLDSNELISLQTDTLKAFFKVDNIDREGSFLNHFHSKIHQLIGSPYREWYTSTILVEDKPTGNPGAGGEDFWTVTDILTYKCRMVGDRIQESVIWLPSKGELTEIEKVTIELKCPAACKENCANPCTHKETCGKPLRYKHDELEKYTDLEYEEGYEEGYRLDLTEFQHVDGLQVRVRCVYLLPKRLFSTCQMAHPTKGLSITIKFPEDHFIKPGLFGLGEDLDVIKEPGLYKIKSDSWILPNMGIAYQINELPENNKPPEVSMPQEEQ